MYFLRLFGARAGHAVCGCAVRIAALRSGALFRSTRQISVVLARYRALFRCLCLKRRTGTAMICRESSPSDLPVISVHR